MTTTKDQEAPERIWAWHHHDQTLDARLWEPIKDAQDNYPGAEYVRADLAQPDEQVRTEAEAITGLTDAKVLAALDASIVLRVGEGQAVVGAYAGAADALFDVPYCECTPDQRAAILALTPSAATAALARHDAETRANALREAATACQKLAVSDKSLTIYGYVATLGCADMILTLIDKETK